MITIFTILLLNGIVVFGQNTQSDSKEESKEILFVFFAQNEDEFISAVCFLENHKYVDVMQHCFSERLIYVIIDNIWFEDEAGFFEMFQNAFTETMHIRLVLDESGLNYLYTQCYSEIVKQ